jgi:hypothetical protein
MDGWAVSVTTPGVEPPEVRLFAVRTADPADAIALVRKAVRPRDDQAVGLVAKLSREIVAQLRLAPDEVVELTQ